MVIASGRFRKPHIAPGLGAFGGEVIHAFDYPGAEPFRGRRVLVYGNGISGLEIASDLAAVTPVVSAFRKPRYVIQKVVDGVSSDWQWYTAFGALERRQLPRDEVGRRLRDRVLRVAGNPASYGAPEPLGDFFAAGISLCEDYLAQVADGSITCRRPSSRSTGPRSSSPTARPRRSTPSSARPATRSTSPTSIPRCGPCSAPSSPSTSGRCIPTWRASA